MSNAAQFNTGGLPKGELLGRYRTYDDAQRVVDHLAAAEGFDIKTITIVGNDLRSVEHIRSRLSYPRVAGAGAAQGAMFGFFIGLLMWLFAPEAPVVNLLLSVVLGMCIWMLIGVISYAVRRGRRDFSSSSQLVATTFDVVCDFSVAGKARQLVSQSGVISLNAWNDPTGSASSLAPPAASAKPAEPAGPEQRPAHTDLPDGTPRYGVRIEEKQKPDGDAPDSAASSSTPQEPSSAPQQPEAPPEDSTSFDDAQDQRVRPNQEP
ncbi:general stress protein [Garicola koreensis]|uniref:General stress protein 17M-like domain-containing protein n=1 Tax=Garicola koreensis TaxID=1262554 RepID=A0A7W5TUC3_9MICC|nr:general stress protein [Garicola koreensis]MBB3667923.1 hypothetical protein [Garicola koreensis]